MEAEVGKKSKFRECINLVSTIISWTIFALLIICAICLTYYFIATKIYAAKGRGYEPKFSLYTIISPSMTPNIKVYDVVIDVKVNAPEEIGINDVITFNSDNPELKGGTITHRVIAITKDNDNNYYYQTKGDANLVEDTSLVPYEKIVGKVALKVPQLGRVQFFLASSIGWLLLVLIPALYIIFKDILKIVKITKESDESNNNAAIEQKEIAPVSNIEVKEIPADILQSINNPVIGSSNIVQNNPIINNQQNPNQNNRPNNNNNPNNNKNNQQNPNQNNKPNNNNNPNNNKNNQQNPNQNNKPNNNNNPNNNKNNPNNNKNNQQNLNQNNRPNNNNNLNQVPVTNVNNGFADNKPIFQSESETLFPFGLIDNDSNDDASNDLPSLK